MGIIHESAPPGTGKMLSDYMAPVSLKQYQMSANGATDFRYSQPDQPTWELVDFPDWQCFYQEMNELDMLFTGRLLLSPIIWQDNIRLAGNYESAGFAGIEFDDGEISLEQASHALSDFSGIIYTTKSHRRPKGKAGLVCDRFRTFIGLSRVVNNMDDYTKIMRTLAALVPESCPNNVDAARFFAGGIATGTMLYLSGQHSLDVDKLLAYANTQHLSGAATVKTIAVKCSGGSPDGYLMRELNRWIDTRDAAWQGKDTFAKFFSLAVHAFHLSPNAPIVSATVAQIPFVLDWLRRKPQQNACYEKQIQKAYSIWQERVLADQYQPIEPRTHVQTVDAMSLPAPSGKHQSAINGYRGKYSIASSLAGDATHRLFKQAMEGRQKRTILCAGCGAEKTTASRAYIATHSSQYSQFLIVKRTRQDCREERDVLKGMGLDCGMVVGYDEAQCPAKHHWRVIYQRNSPCKECQNPCDFGISRAAESEQFDKPACVITHERFLRMMLEWDIPKTVTVIIDEQLNSFEMLKLTTQDRKLMSQALTVEGEALVGEWLRRMDELAADDAPHYDTVSQVDAKLDDLNHIAWLSMEKELKHLRRPEVNNEQFEAAWRFMQFFNCSGKFLSHAYVMRDKSDGSLNFYRDCISLELIENRMVILDASAKLSPVAWRGFVILEAAEHLEADKPNMRIHVIAGNPTKAALNRRLDNLKETVTEALKAGVLRPLICTNKDILKLPAELGQYLKELLAVPGAMQITKCNTTGTNAARDCDACIIAMSLFSTVTDYALKASVLAGQAISRERIWKESSGKLTPNMTFGFNDKAINDVYRRAYCDELYQTIMRGAVRVNPNAPYEVVAFIDSYEMLVELERLLPGAEIIIHGDGAAAKQMRGYLELTKTVPEAASYPKLAKLMGYHPKDGETLEVVRAIFAAVSLSA